MARVVIFGAADIARLAHVYFTRDSEHDVVAFAVDREFRKQDTLADLPVIDFEDVTDRYPPSGYSMFIALSYGKMNRIRAAKYQRAREFGYSLVSCQFEVHVLTDHPSAQLFHPRRQYCPAVCDHR